MNTNSERFMNNTAATGTPLRSSAGVNLDKQAPGAFSLGLENTEEHTPRCVADAFGKMFVFNHAADVQLFNGDGVVSVNDFPSQFMQKVTALLGNVFVRLGNKKPRLFPTRRSALSARQALLRFFKPFLGANKEFWRVNSFAVARCDKTFQPDINAAAPAGSREQLGFATNNKINVPLIISSGNGKRLRLRGQLAVPLHFHKARVLNIQSFAANLAAIPEGRVFKRVKTTGGTEPGEAAMLAGLSAGKEGAVSLFEPAESLLQGGIIGFAKFRTVASNCREFFYLVKTRYRLPPMLVRKDALFKRGVIKPPVQIKLMLKRLALRFGWVKSISKGFQSLPLLIGDVIHNNRVANKPDGTNVVRARPQRRHLFEEVPVPLSKGVRRKAFYLSNDVLGRKGGRRGNKQVNVVGHYLQGTHLDPNLAGFLPNKLFEFFGHNTSQHRLAALGTPHNMIVNVVNTSGRNLVSFGSHKPIIPYIALVINNKLKKERSRDSAVA